MTLTTKIIATVIALAIATMLLNFAIRHFTDPVALGGHSTSREGVDVVISQTTMKIPKNIIRRKQQRITGRHQVMDLYFQWPSLKGYSREDAALYENTNQLNSLIFVSLIESDAPNSPEQRLEGIYRRFFTGRAWRGPDNLIGQTLDPKSGYESEDVFYARNGESIFVTRCLQQQEADKSQVLPTCLYDFQLEERITVNIRFHRNLLNQWREIDKSIKRQLISMRTN